MSSQREQGEGQLPEEFVERLQRILPKGQLDEAIASFGVDKPVYFRLRVATKDQEDLLEELRREGTTPERDERIAGAYRVPSIERDRLTHSRAAEEGRIYIQQASSQLASPLLAPQPGETVMDLAAAPGGKAIHLADLMHNEGLLSVVEPVRGRFFRLQANLKRCGVTIAKGYMTDGRKVGRKVPERFDRVLLDAPCSSEARIDSRNPKTWDHWSPRKVKQCAGKQMQLLLSAFDALKPGGRLLYSTCSFAPEENEAVVDRLLKERPAASVEPIQLDLPNTQPGLTQWENSTYSPSLSRTLRILPTHEFDGFFLCLLAKQ